MARKIEWLPWYRRQEYKGNLTEEEQQHLDTFRLAEKHPAAAVEDLPEEVQGYLSELELAVYDAKQDNVATKAFALTGVGAFLIFIAYHELGWLSPFVGYFFGGAIIAFAWVKHSREWKNNAEGLWIKQEGNGVPFSRTEEKLLEYWELNAISRFRKRHDVEIDQNLA